MAPQSKHDESGRKKDDKPDRKREEGGRDRDDSERTVPNPVQVQKFLGGLDYPVSKQDILDRARDNGADENVMDALERIPDREYDGPTAVSREVGQLE